MANTILYSIIGIIILEFVLGRFLDYLNDKNWSTAIPKTLEGLYNEDEYKRAQEYDKVNGKISLISNCITTTITLILLFAGGFSMINQYILTEITEDKTLSALLFFAVLGLGSTLIGLPFSIYQTFVIEERFGFNKMNFKTFFFDLLKSSLLGIILGGGLLYLFLWFYHTFPEDFWWYAWIMITIVSLFFAMFYTDLIVPLFNKLKALEKGELRQEIESFAQKVNFPLNKIMVIDGSKRSTKSNAYFSGLGKNKKIVLFDTLIQGHSKEELTAVLAHEVGHYQKKHILWSMLLSILQMGLMLFLLQLFIHEEVLSEALGADSPYIQLSLIAFTLLYSPLSMITGVFMNILSRKNEYEADAFARDHYNGEALISALKKLSVKNLSNLNPHPLYVWFHYSHPTLLQRINAIRKKN